MASRLIEIADALVQTLNAAEFSAPIEAVRRHNPRFDLEDLDELKVSVVPRRRRLELATRGDLERTYQIDVAFHRHLQNVGDQQAEAELIALCEEVESLVIGSQASEAVCTATEGIAGDDEAYALELLRERNVFFWGFTATFWETT